VIGSLLSFVWPRLANRPQLGLTRGLENFSLWNKAGDGRCWPGGHASSGFTLLALYFVALRHRWMHARKLLVAILLVGFVYGTIRVLQGWHYMSHTFWAGIFVWLTTWATALVFYGRHALQGSKPERVSHDHPVLIRSIGKVGAHARIAPAQRQVP
jgi:membrane-associated phospholipid phosphatase